MLSLTLLLTLILSFVLPDWRAKWVGAPLQSYAGWLMKTFSLEDSRWFPVALILPLLLVVSLFEDWFESFLLFVVVFTYIAWFVVDLAAIDPEANDRSDETVFGRANAALFNGAIWFVLVHPLAAVGYRLMVWLSDNDELEGHDEWSPILKTFRSWLEWPGSFVTSLFISLTGKILPGLRQLSIFPIFGEDIDELNRMRVLRTAQAALGDEITDTSARAYAARQLVIRGFLAMLLVLWLLELVS